MSLAIGKQLTVEQRLQKATIDLIGEPEFAALAGVLMIGTKKICDKTPTACTNGRDEIYGREFVSQLSDAEFRFLILHECYHKMYKHLSTWKYLSDDSKELCNAACDYVINVKLVDTDSFRRGWLKFPSVGGLLDERFRGMNVPEVYKILRDEAESNSSGGSAQPGDGFDDHDWDGAVEMSAEEAQELAKQIDEAVRQGAILAGKIGTGGERLLSELLETKQDWRELLRDFVTSVCEGKDYSTWRKPSRRYIGMDMLMPGSISEAVGDMLIACDTSGSIGDKELGYIMGEVTGICNQVRPSRVHMVYWDTAVRRHEIYLQDELDDLAKTTKPAGGGGTDVRCVGEFMRERSIKPECVVVLTDGYLGRDWGTWDTPVLWAVINNRHATAPTGKTVHID